MNNSPDISEWMRDIFEWAKSKGWHDKPICAYPGQYTLTPTPGYDAPLQVDYHAVGASIALIHSELSEALEHARDDRWIAYDNNGKPDGFVIELADAMIRIMHLAKRLGLDLEGAIETKMAYNRTRAHRHGGKKL